MESNSWKEICKVSFDHNYPPSYPSILWGQLVHTNSANENLMIVMKPAYKHRKKRTLSEKYIFVLKSRSRSQAEYFWACKWLWLLAKLGRMPHYQGQSWVPGGYETEDAYLASQQDRTATICIVAVITFTQVRFTDFL